MFGNPEPKPAAAAADQIGPAHPQRALDTLQRSRPHPTNPAAATLIKRALEPFRDKLVPQKRQPLLDLKTLFLPDHRNPRLRPYQSQRTLKTDPGFQMAARKLIVVRSTQQQPAAPQPA